MQYPYYMVVLHACIHAPMVRLQPKPKIVRSANGSTEYSKPTNKNIGAVQMYYSCDVIGLRGAICILTFFCLHPFLYLSLVGLALDLAD